MRGELGETLRTDGGARLGRDEDFSTGLGCGDRAKRVRCWAEADIAVTEVDEVDE